MARFNPTFLSRFARDEAGANAIEYGLMAGLVCIPLIAALQHMNDMMQGLYRVMDTIREVI